MRILWVEDESRVIETKNTLFDEFSDHITIESNFISALNALNTHLHCYDLLVLDIDLRYSIQNTDFNDYLNKHKTWELNAETLLHEAGFHLFLTAFQQSFPVERISFFTGNVDPDARSIAFNALLDLFTADDEEDNQTKLLDDFKKQIPEHETRFNIVFDQAIEEDNPTLLEKWYQETFDYPPFDQTANTFKKCFKNARIPNPDVFDKKKPEQKQDLIHWLTQHCTQQNPHFAYLTLRRGLLDSLEQLEKEQYQLKPHYNDLLDKTTFIEGIKWLLKPHHHSPQNPEDTLYLTLCDQLSKPFDNYNKPEKPPANLNFLRNWIAHGNIRQCSNLTTIKAETIGFFFLLALEELLTSAFAIDENLQKLFNLLPPASTNQTPKEDSEIEKIIRKIKKNSDKINLIELFYASCLNKLPETHPLYPQLQAAYSKELTP